METGPKSSRSIAASGPEQARPAADLRGVVRGDARGCCSKAPRVRDRRGSGVPAEIRAAGTGRTCAGRRSDLLAAPWNTLAADAARLPFERRDRRMRSRHRHPASPARIPAGSSRRRHACSAGRPLLLVEPWVTPLVLPHLPLAASGGLHQRHRRMAPVRRHAGTKARLRRQRRGAALPGAAHRRRALARPRLRTRRGSSASTHSRTSCRWGSAAVRCCPGRCSPAAPADRLLAPLAPVTALRALLSLG